MRSFIILLAINCFAITANAEGAKLCHIANAGFYATDGKNGVLLDALYRDGLDGFEQASDLTNEKMENAEDLFAKVKVIFASHYHGDHMTGKAMVRHMQNNDDSIVIITEQSKQLMIAGGTVKNAETRIKSFNIPIGESLEIENMPFPIKLYGISHGEGRPDNLGIAVTVAGKTIMHLGDMYGEQKINEKIKVDYLILPFWYMSTSERVQYINSIFNATHIIPMHFALDHSEWMQSMGGLEFVKKRTYAAMSNLMKLDQEMQCIPLN
ncbi:MAG: MBL fold metallo-hydrolase [Emcibacteraceae bacterium]|nr:MBL fold metallo-hydrolase [Emcibacteraceae bacterium]